jgi:hypothetical protein
VNPRRAEDRLREKPRLDRVTGHAVEGVIDPFRVGCPVGKEEKGGPEVLLEGQQRPAPHPARPGGSRSSRPSRQRRGTASAHHRAIAALHAPVVERHRAAARERFLLTLSVGFRYISSGRRPRWCFCIVGRTRVVAEGVRYWRPTWGHHELRQADPPARELWPEPGLVRAPVFFCPRHPQAFPPIDQPCFAVPWPRRSEGLQLYISFLRKSLTTAISMIVWSIMRA